jgi:hypothetical protein
VLYVHNAAVQSLFAFGSPMAFTKQRFLSYFLGFVVAAVAVFALYIYAALSWSYSTGDRAGFMQKISSKGWICKTWEGELSLVALPGAAPEKFYFTVRDEAVAKQVEAAMGQRVTLQYEQHKGLPSSCFGETEYFVTAVKNIAAP